MNLIIKISFILLLFSCSQTKVNIKEVKLSDTSYALNIFLDSFFFMQYDHLRNPRIYIDDTSYLATNWYFDGNEYGDSLIFLKDSVFSKYISTERYKIKLLNYTEICDKLWEFERTQKKFPLILELRYEHYRDSIYFASILSRGPLFTKDSNGNYKEKVSGGFYSGNDTCIFSTGNYCGPVFFRNIIKTYSGFRLENKFIK